MRIGEIDLGDKPVLLAPMEDVTDASFRVVCKKFGADMVYTEFIPSDGLVRDAAKAIAKMKTSEEEAPIAIQIYGNNPEAMVEAAKMADNADQIAGGHGCDVIDINFGCPVSKIAGRGAGSGMMREPDKMVMITESIVNAVRKPVTVKTRLGWDENSKIIVELAERLQDVGIKALTIHGRTRCQMYKGEADWTLIGAVKNNPRMHIPIIGNGDINSAQKAKDAFDRFGVDGIMVGRASFGHPWIFREIKHFLTTGEELPPMSVNDRVALAKWHLSLSVRQKGPVTGVLALFQAFRAHGGAPKGYRIERSHLRRRELSGAKHLGLAAGRANPFGDSVGHGLRVARSAPIHDCDLVHHDAPLQMISGYG